jgi:hypothetical protein
MMKTQSGFAVKDYKGNIQHFDNLNKAESRYSQLVKQINKIDDENLWVRMYGIFGIMSAYSTKLDNAWEERPVLT